MDGLLLLRPGCAVDLGRRVIERDGERVLLTARETELLRYLAERPGQDVSYDELHREVWRHAPAVISRAAFHTAQRLRTKIEPAGEVRHLVTVHGTGLRLVPDAPGPRVEPDEPLGREREIALVREACATHRVVTVTGVGGIGKTAVVRAARVGAAWVTLRGAGSADGVLRRVGSALGIGLGADPVRRIGVALDARGPGLTVLDEVESVADDVRELLAAWLERAPVHRFLLTSRVPLRMYGEVVVPLGPLDRDAARRLWRARARPGREDEERWVDRLGGHPLAIELAAARPDPSPVAAAEDRLAEALGGSIGALSSPARAALARFTAFVGRLDEAAVEAVLDPGAGWPIDLVQELVDANLLRPGGGGWSLLEVVREHVAGRLEAAERTEAELRHGAHLATLARRLRSDALAGQVDDVLAAFWRAISRGDAEVAEPTGLAAARLLQASGPLRAAEAVCRALVDATGSPAGRTTYGFVLMRLGRLDAAQEQLESARGEHRRRGDARGEAQALGDLATVRGMTGDAGEAARLLAEAVELQRAAGDRWSEANSWLRLALVHRHAGAPELAEGAVTRAAALERDLGDARLRAGIGSLLAGVRHDQGRFAEAATLLESVLEAARELGDRANEAVTLGNLGRARIELGEPEEAAALLAQAVELQEELGERNAIGVTLQYLGRALAAAGRPDEARAALQEAVRVADEGERASLREEALAALAALDAGAG
jgi:tetratricopeptide (TPR) repeat protein/DNA-binding winged helix-turn-helix (wHTH) protein